MRLKLDDNERGAFNYLIGGAVIVLTLRGLAWLADALGPKLSLDGMALRPFQQGYLGMRDKLVVVDTSTGLSERLVLAVVLAVGVAFAMAFLFAAVARARGQRAGRFGLWATRSALVVTLCWSLYAAFCVPIKRTGVTDGAMVVNEWRPIAGDIPCPFTMWERTLTRNEVSNAEVTEQAPVNGCDGRMELNIIVNGHSERIAEVDGVCDEDRMALLIAGSNASALLDRELR